METSPSVFLLMLSGQIETAEVNKDGFTSVILSLRLSFTKSILALLTNIFKSQLDLDLECENK